MEYSLKTAEFQQIVRDFYAQHGRTLPWRETTDPYKIFVSEIMLQQTQAERVIPKYKKWIKKWADFSSLAKADKSDILQQWQGLGYNRRANYLYQSAQQIVSEHGGTLPEEESELRDLYGVGDYTAGALQAFCFNEPVVFVETNIRTVFIYHFFPEQEDISDTQIEKKVRKTLPDKRIREWYWALMDYGHYLKQKVGNLNKQSQSYQTQSQFAGSNRQLRSKLLRFILEHQPVNLETIKKHLNSETERQESIETNLQNLTKDGLISRGENGLYQAE
jgi:A/G-specific adenine glycosylase